MTPVGNISLYHTLYIVVIIAQRQTSILRHPEFNFDTYPSLQSLDVIAPQPFSFEGSGNLYFSLIYASLRSTVTGVCLAFNSNLWLYFYDYLSMTVYDHLYLWVSVYDYLHLYLWLSMTIYIYNFWYLYLWRPMTIYIYEFLWLATSMPIHIYDIFMPIYRSMSIYDDDYLFMSIFVYE